MLLYQVIDPIAPRYFALLKKDVIPVYVDGAVESSQLQPNTAQAPQGKHT